MNSTPLDTKLPYEFDLLLDVKNMGQLVQKWKDAKDTLETINMLIQAYPDIILLVDKENE